MSKLYSTLEKIRTGEQGGLFEKKPAPVKGLGRNAEKSRKEKIFLLVASVLLVLSLIVFLSGPKRTDTKPPTGAVTTDAVIAPAVPAKTVATSVPAPTQTPDHPVEPAPEADKSPKLPPAPPVSLTTSPIGTGGNDLYLQLNDTGLALIQENQHWRGIYYLEQAHKLQPERPEALINMAVALAELGLRAPAQRLFSEAHALAPNHPLLRQNLELLQQADFFDGQWFSSLTAGQPQPRQKTQPQ